MNSLGPSLVNLNISSITLEPKFSSGWPLQDLFTFSLSTPFFNLRKQCTQTMHGVITVTSCRNIWDHVNSMSPSLQTKFNWMWTKLLDSILKCQNTMNCTNWQLMFIQYKHYVPSVQIMQMQNSFGTNDYHNNWKRKLFGEFHEKEMLKLIPYSLHNFPFLYFLFATTGIVQTLPVEFSD